ncbi:MAG: 2-C-methyl-D-erythritol 4-phosphate cytidylyltransferase [Lachnospiraceae bacterium]|nr:2-C-methyl-D-erythritol 4-phosphate cytidylyltransferase [Lachnospiraceae bacterium]
MKNVAIVLAGGSGSRMKSKKKKQYLLLGDRPVLWYSLFAFQNCPYVDEIVLVCGEGEEAQCRETFAEGYGFSKIRKIIHGGKERYHSVYEGLKAAESCDYILIHDGARPFIDAAMLERIFDSLRDCPACVVGMPVKDTIKMRNAEGYVEKTLPREKLWTIQTPQSFSYPLIRQAYDKLMLQEQNALGQESRSIRITDDAMVAETFLHVPVKLIEGSYENLKITTPEDLILAEKLAKHYVSDRKENNLLT